MTGTTARADASNDPDKKASDALADEVGLVRPPVDPPAPAPSQPAPGGVRAADPRALENDIASILKQTPLPERRDFRASGDTPPQPPQKNAEVPPPAPAPVEAPPPTADESRVSSVHTLKDDLQTVVRNEKITMVRAAALEEEKRARLEHELAEEAPQPRHRRFAGTFVTIFLLLFLGAAALGAVYLVMQAREQGGENSLYSDSLLFSEQTIPFGITGESALGLRRGLATARASTALTLGAITRLVPIVRETGPDGIERERAATLIEFLTAIEAHAPGDLTRALDSNFFFGIHTVDENAPVLVIPVQSYERAFAGMLAWEKTMNADLTPIYTAVTPLVRNQEGFVVERPFEDLIMRNYDVRALKDDSGTIQLYYSFPTREYLIIAESPYSFTEVLSRLRAERKL